MVPTRKASTFPSNYNCKKQTWKLGNSWPVFLIQRSRSWLSHILVVVMASGGGKEQRKRWLVLDTLHPWTNGSSPAKQSQQQLSRRFYNGKSKNRLKSHLKPWSWMPRGKEHRAARAAHAWRTMRRCFSVDKAKWTPIVKPERVTNLWRMWRQHLTEWQPVRLYA